MALEEKTYDVESNNEWAKNVKGQHLYIDNAISGRKGYFCIGCDKEMDAVKKKKNPNHRSYFRHVPVDITKDETPCTFSNRQYRELLATDILQRLKTIKVPSVYKYPPKGEEGAPMLLEKAKFITAHKVKSQLTFYEDEEGAVKFGKNPEVENRYLLIRPDVVFFDANNKPILLIELVITHKVNAEKKVKLRRLGIDTISIIVPKSSEQEIEDNFKSTQRVKWEYNESEANTNYIRVSSGTSEGILEFDEHQKRLFEEDINCRKTRLNNTLRTIKKCLLSKSYKRAEYLFESEISRIERATKQAEQELQDLERRYDAEVFTEVKGEYESLEFRDKNFRKEETKFQREIEDLENRYHNKIRGIEEEQRAIIELTEEEIEDHRTEEGIRADFEEEQHVIEQEFIERTDRVILNIRRENKNLELLKRETSMLTDEFRGLEEQEQTDFEAEIKRLESEERNLDQTVREELHRDIKRNPKKFPKGIRNILEAERMGHDFENAKREEKNYKRARELFNKRTW